jgi:hypothetical protein
MKVRVLSNNHTSYVEFDMKSSEYWNKSVQELHNRDSDFVEFKGTSKRYVFPKRDIILVELIEEEDNA